MDRFIRLSILILLLITLFCNISVVAKFAKDPKSSFNETVKKLQYLGKSVSSITSSCSNVPTKKQIKEVKEGLYAGKLTFTDKRDRITGKLRLIVSNGIIHGLALFRVGSILHEDSVTSISTTLPIIFSSSSDTLPTAEELKFSVQGNVLNIKSLKCAAQQYKGVAKFVKKEVGSPNIYSGLYEDEEGSFLISIGPDGSVIITSLFSAFFGKINNDGKYTHIFGPTSMITPIESLLTPISGNSFKLTITKNGEMQEYNIEKFVPAG